MRPRHVNFLVNAAASASGLFIPLYARAPPIGASPEQIGFIVAAYNGFILFASFLFGRAADTRGASRVLRAGLLVSGLAALTQPFAFDPWSLAASRAFLGFAIGMYPAALLVYSKTADRLMGKFSSYGSLGWALGNLAAGIAAQADPGAFWRVFAISSALWFLALFAASAMSAAPGQAIRVPFFPIGVFRRNLSVYSMMFVRHTGANMVWVIFPLYLREVRGLTDLEIGIVYALNPVVQFLVMQGIDRYEGRGLVVAGLVGSALTFLLFTIAWDFATMLAVQALLGFSWATLYVGSLKVLTETNPETGTAGGLFNSVVSLSSILGPLLGGVLAAGSLLVPMYAASLLSAAALAIYAYALRRGARPAPSSPSPTS
jgi:MFS family permease